MYDQILPAVSVTFIPMYCIYMYHAVYTIYLRQISIMFRPSHIPTYVLYLYVLSSVYTIHLRQISIMFRHTSN